MCFMVWGTAEGTWSGKETSAGTGSYKHPHSLQSTCEEKKMPSSERSWEKEQGWVSQLEMTFCPCIWGMLRGAKKIKNKSRGGLDKKNKN